MISRRLPKYSKGAFVECFFTSSGTSCFFSALGPYYIVGEVRLYKKWLTLRLCDGVDLGKAESVCKSCFVSFDGLPSKLVEDSPEKLN